MELTNIIAAKAAEFGQPTACFIYTYNVPVGGQPDVMTRHLDIRDGGVIGDIAQIVGLNERIGFGVIAEHAVIGAEEQVVTILIKGIDHIDTVRL